MFVDFGVTFCLFKSLEFLEFAVTVYLVIVMEIDWVNEEVKVRWVRNY